MYATSRAVLTVMTVAALAGAGADAGAASALTRHPAQVASAMGTISTIAGGVGGPARATSVGLGYPCGVTVAGGNLYVADSATIRKVGSTDWLTTPAGVGIAGAAPDGTPATTAELSGACGATVDPNGNIVVALSSSDLVRVVAASTGTFYGQNMTAGDIYTVAGDGTRGFSGDAGPATGAELSQPSSVAIDRAGNLVIADRFNQRIRVVAASTGTFYGQSMTAGDIYTVAGDGTRGFSGDGGPATSAALANPAAVAVDASGNLVVADTANQRIRVVAASTGQSYGQSMTAGDIYTVAGDGTAGFSGDGGPATSAGLYLPQGVALDSAGNLVIADTSDQRIRVVAAATGPLYGQSMTAGHIYTIAGDGTAGFAGDGGSARLAEFYGPPAVAFDSAGNVVVADEFNGRVRLVAKQTGTFYGRAMTGGDIYTIAGNGPLSYGGDGGPATRAQIDTEFGPVRIDHYGNVLVADTSNNRIRVTAATTGKFYDRAMTAGDIYTVAGGTTGSLSNGIPARKALLAIPQGVAGDSHGNLLLADTGHNLVRVVAAATGTFYRRAMTAGDIYTIAGGGSGTSPGDGGAATKAVLHYPTGVTLDHHGNVLITDREHSRIRVVAEKTATYYGRAMTAGDIYTVAGNGTSGYSGDGGRATQAEVNLPQQVTVDKAGNLVIADTWNNRIRVVAVSTGTFYGRPMKAGDIYTVAGDGTYGFAGDGGPATSAEINFPYDVAVDAAGNIVLADTSSNRIRVVAAATGTFYGQAMTSGDIYTVAGTGTQGFAGDGGQATQAELDLPSGIAVSAQGDLLVADQIRIRKITG